MPLLVILCIVSLSLSAASTTETCANNGDKVAASVTNSIIQGRVDALAGVELKVHPDSDVAKTGRGEWIVWPDRGCRQEDLEALVENMPNNTRAVIHGHPEKGGLCFFIMEGTREGVWQKLAMHRWNSTPNVETDTAVHFDAKEVALESDKLQSEGVSNWGLDRIDQRKKTPVGDGVFEPMSKTGGSGVEVYVMDTGIRTSHKEFQGRAKPKLETFEGVPKECKNTDQDCAADTHGHGTYCAAIVGGTNFGVAKHATLHAVKVHNGTTGTSKTLHIAFDWLLSQNLPTASSIFSVSLSLGAVPKSSASISAAIKETSNRGITAVYAAGNQGQLSYRGWVPQGTAAIAVVAMDRQDHEWKENAKQYDIYAPGVKVASAWIRWNSFLGPSDTATKTFDGTSAAAPHVAGAAALLLAEAKSKGKAFPHGSVKKTLMKYGSEFGSKHNPKVLLYIGDDPEVDWMSEAEEAEHPEERSGSNTLPPWNMFDSDQDVHLVLR